VVFAVLPVAKAKGSRQRCRAGGNQVGEERLRGLDLTVQWLTLPVCVLVSSATVLRVSEDAAPRLLSGLAALIGPTCPLAFTVFARRFT
jgi:hypothetical protein